MIAFVAAALLLSSVGTTVSFVLWRQSVNATRELETQKKVLQSLLIDHAITYAMSGHFERAAMTLEQASDAEADPALVEALRNMALYFSGKSGGCCRGVIPCQ